ncbi:hypothetical protein B0H14DRAFT_3466418 [Mycena olivaceomarginata]|nr:hypothetical protein B0H14DRAFT_3466418 [Mycena olivaceomarginata]
MKEKPRRHRKNDPKARPGKVSWIWGTKLAFFSKRKADWLREAEAKRAGAFYTKMAKLFVKKYGHHLADDQDFDVDVADPPDSAADEVVHEVLTEEEREFRAEHHKTLRAVRELGSAIGTGGEYGSLLKSDETAFKELFTGVLDGAPPKPQRGRIVHFYSRKYYDTRIKSRVDARLASVKRRIENSGEEKPETIDIVSKVTAELWEDESAEFRHEVEVAFEHEYQQNLRAWEVSLADSPTRSPEEIAATLENAAYYLQPFVDAIQQRFGMVATVLLCGPVGMRGGRIGMQRWVVVDALITIRHNTHAVTFTQNSVHAGATLGVAPVDWPTSDWQGFQDVERSMVGFASKCFTDTECRARALPGTAAPPQPPPPLREEETGEIERRARTGPAGPIPTAALSMHAQMTSRAGDSEGRARPGPSPTTAPSTQAEMTSQMETSTGEQDELDEHQREQDERGDEAAEEMRRKEAEEQRRRLEVYDKEWQRDDRAEWTDELGRAHAAFEIGRTWGPQWATCVQRFFDFEGAWGFVKGTFSMRRVVRPQQVSGGRRRARQRSCGFRCGGGWWRSLQPEERELLESGELSRPEKADWSKTAGMYGNNGLLQVMASLLWWGEVVQRREEADREEWCAAVTDVTDAGEEGEDTGERKQRRTCQAKGRKVNGDVGSAGKKRKASDDDASEGEEPQPKKRKRAQGGAEAGRAPRRASRRSGDVADESVRRTRSS